MNLTHLEKYSVYDGMYTIPIMQTVATNPTTITLVATTHYIGVKGIELLGVSQHAQLIKLLHSSFESTDITYIKLGEWSIFSIRDED